LKADPEIQQQQIEKLEKIAGLTTQEAKDLILQGIERKLAEDIGQSLGCGAHITKIKRMGIGPFKLEQAIELDAIHESHLRSPAL